MDSKLEKFDKEKFIDKEQQNKEDKNSNSNCGHSGHAHTHKTPVYVVRNTSGKYVAIKQRFVDEKSQMDSALNEVDVLKRLTHRAIVKYLKHSFQEYKGHQVMCMSLEYVNGPNFSSVLANMRDKPDSHLVLKWFLTLLDALAYMQSNAVVHRNLKPSNLVVDEDANIRIAGFGNALSLSQSEGTFSTITGTPHYMPPEMLRQEGGYDSRVDVWALGCVMFEIITGQMFREVMADKLARTPNLLDVTIDDKGVREVLNLIFSPKSNRPTAQQLLEHEIVKGWKSSLDEKAALAAGQRLIADLASLVKRHASRSSSSSSKQKDDLSQSQDGGLFNMPERSVSPAPMQAPTPTHPPSSPGLSASFIGSSTPSASHTTTSTTPSGPSKAPAALIVRVAQKETEAYELNITLRTMEALMEEFWSMMGDEYSAAEYKIAKIEKVRDATSRINIKQDASVVRLKDDDELIFHLAQK